MSEGGSIDIKSGARLAEACEPPLGGILQRLTREELEDLAARFYGREPIRFEELLLDTWSKRLKRAA